MLHHVVPGPSGGAPRVLGDLGRMGQLFIFRDLGSTGNCFRGAGEQALRGAGEQAHGFGDLGSPAKKQIIIKEKPPLFLIF